MDSAFITNERMLSLVTEQLNNVLNRAIAGNNVGVCGLPCVGDCQTCTQSNADLAAFFGPSEPAPVVTAAEASASVEGSGPSAAEPHPEGDEDGALEVARAMDALDEAQRSGEAYDYEEDEDDYRGCQCLDCLNHDDPNYTRYYEDDDGGYGLDWNESGYFD